MVVLTLTVPVQQSEVAVAELWEAGAEGIREGDEIDGEQRMEGFFADEVTARSLAETLAHYQPQLAPADERDWVAHSRSLWHSVEVGDRFYLVPEWESNPEVPEGRILLPMPVGQGFGSGFHESTQLALSALENTPIEGANVLDIGTGSGILLAASHKLGASRLCGCDVDPVAVESARNYLSGLHIPAFLYLGSIDAVCVPRFHLVLANLNATLILNLLDDLMAALRPHGRLILSGILADEAAAIRRALEEYRGVTRIYHAALGDWVNFRVTAGAQPSPSHRLEK